MSVNPTGSFNLDGYIRPSNTLDTGALAERTQKIRNYPNSKGNLICAVDEYDTFDEY